MRSLEKWPIPALGHRKDEIHLHVELAESEEAPKGFHLWGGLEKAEKCSEVMLAK